MLVRPVVFTRESIANNLIIVGLSVAAVATALFGIALVNFAMLLGLIGVVIHPRGNVLFRFASWPTAAWLSVGLFGWIALSWLWSDAGLDQKSEYLRAYRELLLVPIFAGGIYLCRGLKVISALLFWSLAASVVVTYLLWFGQIQIDGAQLSIKNRIFFGVSTATFAFWSLVRSERGPAIHRLTMAGCALLAIYALLLIETGRTGYVLTAALASFWIYGLTKGRNWLRLAGLVLIAGAISAGYGVHDKFQSRVDQSVANTLAYFESGQGSSIGYRLEFYRVSLVAIKEAPVFGHGVGSFREAHGRFVDPDRPWGKTDNPHQEYLLIGVQSGLVGVALFVSVLCATWVLSSRMPSAEQRLLRGGVLALAISCLFNSSLLDSGDGSFFTLFLACWLSTAFSDRSDVPGQPISTAADSANLRGGG
ncbi:MAG: O-antigen ligase family protein [Litorivicinus sp.]